MCHKVILSFIKNQKSIFKYYQNIDYQMLYKKPLSTKEKNNLFC
jgi:hypothetical protein